MILGTSRFLTGVEDISMKMSNGLAAKKVLWALSLGLVTSFATVTLSGCAGGGDKKDKEEVGADEAGSDAPKKDKKKGSKKKDKKDKKDKKKDKGDGGDAAAKDPA